MFDVKAKADEIIKKVSEDKSLAKNFLKAPVKTVEDLLGVDLPNDTLNAIVVGVKGKINVEKLAGMLDSDGDGKPELGALGKISEVFKK